MKPKEKSQAEREREREREWERVRRKNLICDPLMLTHFAVFNIKLDWQQQQRSRARSLSFWPQSIGQSFSLSVSRSLRSSCCCFCIHFAGCRPVLRILHNLQLTQIWPIAEGFDFFYVSPFSRFAIFQLSVFLSLSLFLTSPVSVVLFCIFASSVKRKTRPHF